LRPNDVKRGDAGIVKSYVQRASHILTVARIVLRAGDSPPQP
jgi:hypothetical protein